MQTDQKISPLFFFLSRLPVSTRSAIYGQMNCARETSDVLHDNSLTRLAQEYKELALYSFFSARKKRKRRSSKLPAINDISRCAIHAKKEKGKRRKRREEYSSYGLTSLPIRHRLAYPIPPAGIYGGNDISERQLCPWMLETTTEMSPGIISEQLGKRKKNEKEGFSSFEFQSLISLPVHTSPICRITKKQSK